MRRTHTAAQATWPCRMTGRIHGIDGRVRLIDRTFEGAGNVRAAALAALAERRDRGAPWYGGAVDVVTPLGQRLTVDVPWPEDQRRGGILCQMASDLEAALVSVRRSLQALERSPDANLRDGSVVPSAIRDLRIVERALVRVADQEQSPYVWEILDARHGGGAS